MTSITNHYHGLLLKILNELFLPEGVINEVDVGDIWRNIKSQEIIYRVIEIF